MNDSNRGTAFLKELKDFLTFLRSLWGILGGISVLFPLSNILTKVIPLETYDNDGVYQYLSPSLITTFAMFVALFVILWTYGNRNVIKSKGKRRTVQLQAGIWFGSGVLALLIYLYVYFAKFLFLRSGYREMGDPDQMAELLVAEILLLIAYSASFGLFTRTFMLLGMMEFFEKKRRSLPLTASRSDESSQRK